MTGARELVQLQILAAAPEHVHISVMAANTQLDISLPLDAPVASLIPELVRLVRSRDGIAGAPEEASSKDAKRNFWVLSVTGDDRQLGPDSTLRQAGVVNGSLLQLTAERALSAPTLYDDVVDAAARLNKATHAGWDSAAARWMAFTGIHLTAFALLYFIVGEPFAGHRPALIGIGVVIGAALTAVGALAHRSYGQATTAAALGWAAIPVTAGVAWAALSRFGGYGLAAGCALMVLILFGFHRVVGTGRWAYLAAGVFFALSGVALVVHEVGVRADMVGAGLAVIATLASLTVPLLTAPMGRFKPPRARPEPEPEVTLFENPFDSTAGPTRPVDPEETVQRTPTAEGVWARVRTTMVTRSALYAGFASAAAVGAAAVLVVQVPPHWSGLVFALTCAAALGFYTRRVGAALERVSLAAPAVALVGYSCWAAQAGSQPLPLVAFAVLLLAAVGAAVVGMTVPERVAPKQAMTVLMYLDYLTSAALIPLALWVAGVYSRLGI